MVEAVLRDAPSRASTGPAAASPVLLRMPFSHFCRKAEWGLTAAGIPYRTLDVRLTRMQDQYRANPEGTVPVLRVGDLLHFGSHAVLRWADENRAAAAPPLYPPGLRAEVEALEAWAGSALGPAVRREAYRALHERPGLAARHGLPLWMRTPPSRRFYLKVLKLLKARRFEDEDAQVLRDGVARVARRVHRGGPGFLLGGQATAADLATAALLEPLLPAAELRGYTGLAGWDEVAAYVERVRPARTARTGGRRVREADWREFERLNAAAPPQEMAALRCECGVPKLM